MNNTAVSKLKKQDWIIVRLLYLMSVNDPTVWQFRDVKKTQAYLNKRYGIDFDLSACLELVFKEYRELDTFNKAKDTKIHKELSKSIDIKKFFGSDEDYDEMDRKFFGGQL